MKIPRMYKGIAAWLLLIFLFVAGLYGNSNQTKASILIKFHGNSKGRRYDMTGVKEITVIAPENVIVNVRTIDE